MAEELPEQLVDSSPFATQSGRNAVEGGGKVTRPKETRTRDDHYPKPKWMKQPWAQGGGYLALKEMVAEQKLHTVCQEATCPNIATCWSRKSLTIMILGDICTRKCTFCDVMTGRPRPVDPDEPRRVAESLATLGLRHTVITSVDRDDLKDGGANHWAAVIRAVREAAPTMTLETLVGDFQGKGELQDIVFAARPDVLSHNLETVPRLDRTVRHRARHDSSLRLLERAKAAGLITKTGLMLGLGETNDEVIDVMKALRAVDCDILTCGQYLAPSKNHHPVERFVPPHEFDEIARLGRELGFRHVAAGPLVRSSFLADTHVEGLLPPKAVTEQTAPRPSGTNP